MGISDKYEGKGLLGFDPYGDTNKSDYASDLEVAAPTETFDFGDLAGVGSKTNAGKIGSLGDSFLGTGGILGTAFDAASRVNDEGKWEAAAPSLMQGAASMLARQYGVPIGPALSMVDKMGKNVKAGMTPEDSILGTALDFGLDLGLLGVSSMLGPIGTLLGGVAAGFIDVSKVTDGVMGELNDWGKMSQIEANVATRQATDFLGITDTPVDYDTLKEAMDVLDTDSIDTALEHLGQLDDMEANYESESGYGGKGGISGGLGLGQEGVGEGLGGFSDDGDFGDHESDPGGMGGV